ncbi:MAG TPA: hypothetical protein ENK73_00085, partial [Thiomicrospira sp.]|nr:hypothetical protein [Thiomicrospira sp.]
MKHLKITSIFSIIGFLLIISVNAQKPTSNLIGLSDLKSLKTKLHPVALKAINKGEKPASFKNVKIAFKPNVVILKKDEVQELKTHLKQG